MSRQDTRARRVNVVGLDNTRGIQQAADFSQAIPPWAGRSRDRRINASASVSVHFSTMQILPTHSPTEPDFEVIEAAADCRTAPTRVGPAFARNRSANPSNNWTGSKEVFYG